MKHTRTHPRTTLSFRKDQALAPASSVALPSQSLHSEHTPIPSGACLLQKDHPDLASHLSSVAWWKI